MKKPIALLLSLLMMFSAGAALASETMALDEKLSLQLQNGSGLTAEIAFTASQELNLSILDEQTNAMLRVLLADTKLDFRRIQGAGSGNRGKDDTSITLSGTNASLLDFRHTSDGVLEAYTSSLFGGKSYASARGDGLLLDLLLDRDTTWPGLERAMLAMDGADLEWRNQAEAQLKTITDKLSLWLQGYTRVSTERDEQNQLITVNTITIPAADLKTNMKAMLSDLYANRSLINLLRETMTATEGAAYLESSMLPGFQAAIDNLPVSGTVSILRRYDSAGRALLEDMVFPMGGTRGIQSIHYRMEAAEENTNKTIIEVTMLPKGTGLEEGSYFSLSFEGGPVADAQGEDVESYTGTLLMRREPEGNEGFTVQAGEEMPEEAYDFNLYLDRGLEVQDTQTRRYSRVQEYSLLIKPVALEGKGDQSIKLSLTLSSGADTRSATRLDGSFVWQDLSNESKIEAVIGGGSAAPWVIPSVDASGAIRLDRMNDSQLATQKTQLQADLLTAVTRLGLSFLGNGK